MNWEFLIHYAITPQSLELLGWISAVHFFIVTVLWVIGLRQENHSILDVYWGFSFVIAGWMAFELGGADTARAKLVVTLVTIWGARLGYHLLSRWARITSLGGDARYQDIKDNRVGKKGYWWKSLLLVIWPMALGMIVAQLNIIWLIITPQQPPLGMLDYTVAALMLCAIVLETTADLQLDAFKANHANEGKVLKTGVWAWSRHPNYFADFCCYWCVFIISLAAPQIFWTIVSPLVMSWLLIAWTGKSWLDEHMKKRRPEYAEYVRTTSGFVPLPPRRK